MITINDTEFALLSQIIAVAQEKAAKDPLMLTQHLVYPIIADILLNYMKEN